MSVARVGTLGQVTCYIAGDSDWLSDVHYDMDMTISSYHPFLITFSDL